MPAVGDWEDFEHYFETMRGYGIVESMKDFYWDIRPKPEYGTVEIRVCDTPLAVAPFVGLKLRQAGLVALALTPMSGLAVVMVYETASLYPEIRSSVAPVVFAAVVILELLGPIATQFAIKQAGEAGAER